MRDEEGKLASIGDRLLLIKKYLFPLLSLVIFVVFAIALGQKLQEYSWSELVASVRAIPVNRVRLAMLLTVLGYFVIAHYDKIAFAAAGYSLANRKILTTTFLSYAICNNLGFMLLIGGGIRYYFYRSYGVPRSVIATAIAFSNLNFWLGLFALGGVVFSFSFLEIPEILLEVLRGGFVTARPLGYFFLTTICIYLYLSWQQITIRFRQQSWALPRLEISLAQISLSALDWAIASGILYLLLPEQNQLNYANFFGVYLLAIAARTISNVPGGLGVFETTIMAFLPGNLSESDIFAALIAYRGIYFLLPLLIALILFGISELSKKNR